MSRYRKKPVVIEALQFTNEEGGLASEIVTWIETESEVAVAGPAAYYAPKSGTLAICTLEGTMHASIGDWIIKGVKGEFYPCKPDIFAATYEPVTPPSETCRYCGKPRRDHIETTLEDGVWTSCCVNLTPSTPYSKEKE